MDYHWGLMTEEERRDSARDLGVALGWAARSQNSPQRAKGAATLALPLLEAAVRDRPDDIGACEALGHAFRLLGRPEDALRAFEDVLHIEPGARADPPDHGPSSGQPATVRELRGVLEKAIAVNPWCSDYRAALAQVCYDAGDWSGAIAACQAAIRLNPELFATRSLLIQSLLRSHQPEKADAEFLTLLSLYPASREVWQNWYQSQKQEGPRGAHSSTGSTP